MSETKMTGKIEKIFESVQVTSEFTKREFVIDTGGKYPEILKFELIQDACDRIDHHKLGDTVEVFYNLRGRKWINPEGEAKYFISLNCWKIEKFKVEEDEADRGERELAEKDNDLPF